MSEPATTTPAPAPAAAPAAPADSGAAQQGPIHAGMPFHEFQEAVAARMAARERGEEHVDQPPGHKPTVIPQPKSQSSAAPPTETPEGAPSQPEPEPKSKTLDGDKPEEPKPEERAQLADDELLAKVKQWLAGDTIPEEFASKLVALKNGDEVEYETFDEVRNGRMRLREFIRSQQKFDKERADWEAREGFYKSHFDAIFSDERDGAAGGDAMYEIYTRAGKRKQLLALGAKLAAEEQEDIDGANGMGYAVMQRMRITDPNDYRVQEAVKKEFARRQAQRDSDARTRATDFENQRLRQDAVQRDTQNQNQEYYATQKRQLDQLRPRAFEAVGLNHEDPVHRDRFDNYLGAVLRQQKAEPGQLPKVTPELVMSAARAALEDIRDERKQRAGAGGADAARKAQAQAVGFQPQLGGGGGKANGQKPQQWHADNFAEHFKLRTW